MSIYLIPHYLEAWVLPPGINILLALVGLAVYWHWSLAGKILILAGFLSLWLASAPIVAYNLLEILQNHYPALSLDKVAKDEHAVIVVLGGGNLINVEQGNKNTVSDQTLNRIRYSAYLHQKTKLPIIVSGGPIRGMADTEANLMLEVFQKDFNIASVIKEDKSNNTAEEGKYLLPILKQQRFDKVYLVTNAWHMPRSMFAFKGEAKEGIKIIPAPMGYQVYDHRYSLLSYLPNVNALNASSTAMHEFLGLFWYYLRS